MPEWEFKPIREWRERNPGADRPSFAGAKWIVRELLADEDLSEIQSRGEAIGRSWPKIGEGFGQGRAAVAIRNWIAASEKDFVELTRFRGYLILLGGGGIHDATNTRRIPA